jgi:hypothetical protein
VLVLSHLQMIEDQQPVKERKKRIQENEKEEEEMLED